VIPAEIIARYRGSGVLVDTNLLLMYFVGVHDPGEIARFKRTTRFTSEDHALLLDFLGRFRRLVTTPHILTEVSNLAGQMADRTRAGIFETLSAGMVLLDEQHDPAAKLASDPSFRRFGITDSAVLHRARGRYLVLTDDFRLSQYLQSEGVDVFNFHHLRFFDVLR
jgi:rRNA-processing protein FCF1